MMTDAAIIEQAKVSLHEAGHVAVALHHGYRFSDVCLHDDGLTGKMRGPRVADRLVEASIALAGPVIEAIATGIDPAKALHKPGMADDKKIAIDALGKGGPDLFAALERTKQIIDNARPQIVALAQALNRHRKLSFEQAQSITRKARVAHDARYDTHMRQLAATMPSSWLLDYKLQLASDILTSGRATPQRQMAFDSAHGLRRRRAADAASPKGGTSMPFPARRMTRDVNPVAVGRTVASHLRPPGVTDQDPMNGGVDPQTIIDAVGSMYHQLDPDAQSELCAGLAQLIDAHENGGSMNGEPNTMMNGDEDPDDLGVRGSNVSNLMNEGSNAGSGAVDRRRRRYGATDTRSRQLTGFAQRWPDALKISIRG